MVFCCIHIVNIYFLECRHCADRYGYEEAWRCFFAQYAWRHVRLNTLYHTYLYEYANLAYDTATSADYELFRRELTHVLENGVHHTIFPFQPQHHNSSVTGTARTSSRGMLCCQGMVADSGHTLGQADGNTHWLPNVRRPLNVFAPACHLHQCIDSDLFRTSSIRETGLQGAIHDWLQGHAVQLIDRHAGIRAEC